MDNKYKCKLCSYRFNAQRWIGLLFELDADEPVKTALACRFLCFLPPVLLFPFFLSLAFHCFPPFFSSANVGGIIWRVLVFSGISSIKTLCGIAPAEAVTRFPVAFEPRCAARTEWNARSQSTVEKKNKFYLFLKVCYTIYIEAITWIRESHEHNSQISSHIVCIRMTSARIGRHWSAFGPQMVKKIARSFLLW